MDKYGLVTIKIKAELHNRLRIWQIKNKYDTIGNAIDYLLTQEIEHIFRL